MSTALPNSTRATHSPNSYPKAVDIRNSTTKIIGITLTTARITTDYNLVCNYLLYHLQHFQEINLCGFYLKKYLAMLHVSSPIN
jgi:hypothetical protein